MLSRVITAAASSGFSRVSSFFIATAASAPSGGRWYRASPAVTQPPPVSTHTHPEIMDPSDSAPDSWEQADIDAPEAQLNSALARLNVNAKPFVPNVHAAEFVPSFLVKDDSATGDGQEEGKDRAAAAGGRAGGRPGGDVWSSGRLAQR